MKRVMMMILGVLGFIVGCFDNVVNKFKGIPMTIEDVHKLKAKQMQGVDIMKARTEAEILGSVSEVNMANEMEDTLTSALIANESKDLERIMNKRDKGVAKVKLMSTDIRIKAHTKLNKAQIHRVKLNQLADSL